MDIPLEIFWTIFDFSLAVVRYSLDLFGHLSVIVGSLWGDCIWQSGRARIFAGHFMHMNKIDKLAVDSELLW